MKRPLFLLLIFLAGFSCQNVLAQDEDQNFNPDRWQFAGEDGDITVDDISYHFNLDTTAVHPAYCNRGRSRIVIPEYITYEGKNYPVYIIGPLFRYDDELEEIELHCRMNEMWSFFENCSKLKRVKLPDGIKLMGGQSFKSNPIVSLALPKNLKVLDKYAIEWCGHLEKIEVNDSLEEWRGASISTCASMCEFRFPPCFKLLATPFGGPWKRLTFEDGDGDILFDGPHTARYVKFEELEYLYYGRRTLDVGWYIPKLKELVLGEPVEIIKLPSLEVSDAKGFKVYAKSTSPRPIVLDLGKNEEDIFAKSTLFVPEGTLELYKLTDGWRKFANIVEGSTPSGINPSKKSQTVSDRYTLDGRKLTARQKGINIIRRGNGTVRKVIVR